VIEPKSGADEAPPYWYVVDRLPDCETVVAAVADDAVVDSVVFALQPATAAPDPPSTARVTRAATGPRRRRRVMR